MRTCVKCRVALTTENANLHKTGRHAGQFVSYCRRCGAVKNKEYHALHKEEQNAKCRDYRARNREKAKARDLAYYARRKEDIKVRSRAYYARNRGVRIAYTTAYSQNLRKTDPAYRLMHNLRNQTRHGMARAGGTKSHRTIEYIGCSFKELRSHLEKQFRPGMIWENYGPVWHVDHIRPCASFDLSDPEQQRACFHFSNLQPLFAEENLKKGAKWSGNLVD